MSTFSWQKHCPLSLDIYSKFEANDNFIGADSTSNSASLLINVCEHLSLPDCTDIPGP